MSIVLSTRFQGQSVGMLDKLDSKYKAVWNDYPLTLTETEVAACGLLKIMPLLKCEDIEAYLPSKLAGITDKEEKSTLLSVFDDMFRKQMEGFSEVIAEATYEDARTILHIKQNYHIEENYNFISRFFLSIFSTKKFMSGEQFRRDSRAYRKSAADSMVNQNAQFIARMQAQIEATVPRIEKQLKTLSSTDPRRIKSEIAIEQARKTYKAYFNRDLPPELQHCQT